MIVIILSAVFLATAIQHSWRASYNYPVPDRVIGRYVMHLMPLWLIAFMIVLKKIKNVVHSVKSMKKNKTNGFLVSITASGLVSCFKIKLLKSVIPACPESFSRRIPDLPTGQAGALCLRE
ncbi:MAG: hypothetical protein EHM54_11400 [Nitrospiraceae bacterium]|nr:MAG: hypothetical protein EHM54_11400 [Nitrospiraceae bacterium]